MITRIVKMTFDLSKVETFLKVFNESASFIRSYPGCIQMKLLKDIHQQNIYYTYSQWESEEHLNHYRNSTLFRGIWSRTKENFSAKAEAVSLVEV